MLRKSNFVDTLVPLTEVVSRNPAFSFSTWRTPLLLAGGFSQNLWQIHLRTEQKGIKRELEAICHLYKDSLEWLVSAVKVIVDDVVMVVGIRY